ncbi:MAG: tetratricopeptide repeat protein [Sphingobacteriaceae bacterium]
MKIKSSFIKYLLFFLALIQLGSAAAQEESRGTKGMQNLTARYNILFNARELVKQSQENISMAFPDNYSRLIPVFTEADSRVAQAETKKLDEAIKKANLIANEKAKSNYVDDAYLLIGIANHLKTDYYNAVEYFNYVYQNYTKEKAIKQSSLVWKARSLMQLKRFDEAQAVLDTAIKYLKTSKKSITEVYATKTQWHLYAKQYKPAADLLLKAIKSSHNKAQRTRWTFLLAQLEQLNGKPDDAFKHYTEVVKSNAPFEMAFNANLNRISIEENEAVKQVNREERLRALLKDDKNLDLTDQIYYQIGRNFEEKKQLPQAIENYNISIRKNTKNQDQRGLSYLALAEIYFKQADYVNAKKYYDSTLTALPVTHPDYAFITKKNSSLDLLAKNLMIIAEEDTLQMLAALPETERKAKIELMVGQKVSQAEASRSLGGGATDFGSSALAQNPNTAGNKFYFNNPLALSQGFSDFKKRWGNRTLEDNWRISQKALSGPSNQALGDAAQTADAGTQPNQNKAISLAEEFRNNLLFKLPNSTDKLADSNLRIADAYFEVGDYYREVLNDKAEAIRAFETLLKRFPNYGNLAAVYYNLYRLYSDVDEEKSDAFKNRILTNFPKSVFAKVILDPEFSQKQDEQDLALGRAYNQIFEQFEKKDYSEVMNCIRELNAGFGANRLSAQLGYLNSISAGHQQNLSAFENALKSLVNAFPDDKLITPLVKQHLAFIEANRASMAARPIVLVDNDPLSLAMVTMPQPASNPIIKKSAEVSAPVPAADSASAKENVVAAAAAPVQPKANTNVSIFDLKDTQHFYLVINVADPSVNLSSSRFGVGQFNRSNYQGWNLKHELKDVNGENQLIFVGEFTSKESVSEYYQQILPLMRDIMKIPAEKYSLFTITKANLDRITNSETLKQYLEFYRAN